VAGAAAATIGSALVLFDGTVVTVALPSIQRDLELSPAMQERAAGDRDAPARRGRPRRRGRLGAHARAAVTGAAPSRIQRSTGAGTTFQA